MSEEDPEAHAYALIDRIGALLNEAHAIVG